MSILFSSLGGCRYRSIYGRFSVVFASGFRPFFLFASLHAVISMFIWMLSYTFGINVWMIGMNWHAHEMLYGYGMAVVAGFLLTAARVWTGRKTLEGKSLLVLFLLWLVARILSVSQDYTYMLISAVSDLLFTSGLIYGIGRPILSVKNFRQTGIMTVLFLLLIENLLYYIGKIHAFVYLERLSLYGGVYLLLALILIIGRRIIPPFTERGVGYSVSLKNYSLVDRVAFPLFILFVICDLFRVGSIPTLFFATVLFLIHLVRFFGWYTYGIWKKPLLWVLFVSYAFISFGFIVRGLGEVFPFLLRFYLHIFTIGGIGLMTLGMMARVTLGHTGRSVHDPPSALIIIFVLLCGSLLCRVFIPMFYPQGYVWLIGISQILWILSFVYFLSNYLIFFLTPRVDGKPG